MLRTNAYFKKHESYLAVLHRLEANRARGLLAKGEIEPALQAATAAETILPGTTSPAEYLVPEFAKRGRAADADKVYHAACDVLDKLCTDYPQSAEFRNRRAWLAARCHRDLPAAKELAQKATALPSRARRPFRNIGGGLLSKRRQSGALAAIGKAIELEPKNRNWTSQQTRFEAGDPNAPLPEGR